MSRGTPILYIPGIMGSQLYLPEDGRKLWFSPAAVLTDTGRLDISSPLSVKNNGIDLQTKTPLQREHGVLKQDILLIEWLCLSYPDSPVYFFSYDFRRSCREAADALKVQIDQLLAGGAEQVNIVCHSMGGLVTSSYVTRYGADALRNVVMLGVPFEGSYEVARIYLTGDIRDVPNTIAETVGITREMLAGYPGLAELMPSVRHLEESPLTREGELLNREQQEALFAALIPETYKDARLFREEIETGLALLREKENCFFGIGDGKTTLRSLDLRKGIGSPTPVETKNGDGLVTTFSALMGGMLSVQNTRVRAFPVRHANLLRHPDALKWIAECLKE